MEKLTELEKKLTKFIKNGNEKFTIRKELRLLPEHQNIINTAKLILKELNPDESYNDSDIIRMFLSIGFNELESIYYNKISNV